MNTETPETQLPDVPEAEPGMSYLKSVHIKGFRTIRDLETEFLPGLNVIIGENGVGKTNFLVSLNNFLTFENRKFLQNPIYVKVGVRLTSNIFHIISEFSKKEKIGIRHDFYGLFENNQIVIERGEFLTALLAKNVNDKEKIINKIEYIQHKIPSQMFALYPSFLEYNSEYNLFTGKNTGYPSLIDDISEDIMLAYTVIFSHTKDSIRDFIYEKLSKTSVFLSYYLSLYSSVSAVAPDDSIHVYTDKTQGTTRIDNLLLNFQVNGQWLPYDMLSDGTKRIVYIIAKIASAPANSIILLEEPELGIHPHQLYKLMTFIKEQSKEKQIILTTHSPEVLNFIEADELDRIQIAYLKKGAGTQLRRLTPAEQEHARAYMQDLDLSDFWVHAAFEENPENASA